MIEPLVEIAFEGLVIEWRGPAPFFFVAVPPEPSAAIRDAARQVSYGWGCVPVDVEANGVSFTTSLFPKEGGYLVPVKTAVRKAAGFRSGERVAIKVCVSSIRSPPFLR